jgi:hypothetical protein
MESLGLYHVTAIAADPPSNLDESPKELGTDLFLLPSRQSWYAGINDLWLPRRLIRKGAV